MAQYRIYLISAVAWIISVVFSTTAFASEVYSNGYFRYTVEDYSVTIISYTGTENEVTVPTMIAGNPVNVIAEGAFARNTNVKKVNLPDTIMSIEEGAFGDGQSVSYDFESGAGDNGNDATKNKNDKGSEEAGGNSGQEDNRKEGTNGSEVKNGRSGDRDNRPAEADSHVTVDTDNNLVIVDVNGNETVLDDSKNYTVKTDENGNDVIEDSSGNLVEITGDGYIEYIDKDNNRVTVDTKTGKKSVESADGSYSHEGVEIRDASDEKTSKDRKASQEDSAGKKNDGSKDGSEAGKPGKTEANKTESSESDTGKTSVEKSSVSENIPVEKTTAETREFPPVTVIIVIIAVGLTAYIVLRRHR